MLASDTYGDGIGSGTIAVFETAGDRLSYRDNRSAKDIRFYNSAVWEDDTHVLFTLFQDGTWSMVRMGVDGALELALPPQAGKAEEVPWHFRRAEPARTTRSSVDAERDEERMSPQRIGVRRRSW